MWPHNVASFGVRGHISCLWQALFDACQWIVHQSNTLQWLTEEVVRLTRAVTSVSDRVRVIEDVSHAHGGLYRGSKVGTIGDVAAMSVMSEKGLAIGEAGFLITDDQEIYERAVAFGHYERTGWMSGQMRHQIESPQLLGLARVPLGGCKYRMHQLSAAVGSVELEDFEQRMMEI